MIRTEYSNLTPLTWEFMNIINEQACFTLAKVIKAGLFFVIILLSSRIFRALNKKFSGKQTHAWIWLGRIIYENPKNHFSVRLDEKENEAVYCAGIVFFFPHLRVFFFVCKLEQACHLRAGSQVIFSVDKSWMLAGG